MAKTGHDGEEEADNADEQSWGFNWSPYGVQFTQRLAELGERGRKLVEGGGFEKSGRSLAINLWKTA